MNILFPEVNAQALKPDSLKPDYRNHINIPTYDKSLMPLNKVTAGTGTWTELNPKVPRVDYIGVDFVDSLNGWTVGANGVILKTTDGGERWIVKQSGVTNVLTHVNSYNANVVIAVAMGGKILRSSDKGENWTEIQSGTTRDLWRVQMLNDTLGWISGTFSTLLRTTDSGLSWQSVPTGYPQNYWSLDFLNEDFGFICCSNGYVLKTTNGGIDWQQYYTGEDDPLYCITVLDTQTILTGGFGKIVSTYDGGSNWNINGLGGIFYCLAFRDGLYGIALNTMGSHYYQTTDRGITWKAVDTYRFANNWADFVNNKVAVAVGDGLNILKTNDGGNVWRQLIINDDFNDVFFINESKGFAISFYSLYQTFDGGINWQKRENAPSGYDLLFLDSMKGFICGQYILYKTTDGGDSWYPTNTLGLNTSKVFFITDEIGWALSSGKILKTTDSGENWFIQLDAGGAVGFKSIYFVDSLYGWTANINGRPFKTTDGGTNWTQQNNLNFYQTNDVYFSSRNIGWIIDWTSWSTLNKTTDSGLSWTTTPEVIGAFGFHFFPYQQHWMINGSRRYITQDGGSSFIDITNNVPTGFNNFSAVTDRLGYAVGSVGLILKYVDTSYVPVNLVSFEGRIANSKIILSWITASELNNNGFYIEKSFDKTNWLSIGFLPGNGTTTMTNYYIFSDQNINGTGFYYRIKQVDFDGNYTYSKIIYVSLDNKILTFELFQNYPNPFNPQTNINYSIPKTDFVNISLYSILGDKITELINEVKQPGVYKTTLDASNLASGIYFYKMTAGSGYASVKKITIIK